MLRLNVPKTHGYSWNNKINWSNSTRFQQLITFRALGTLQVFWTHHILKSQFQSVFRATLGFRKKKKLEVPCETWTKMASNETKDRFLYSIDPFLNFLFSTIFHFAKFRKDFGRIFDGFGWISGRFESDFGRIKSGSAWILCGIQMDFGRINFEFMTNSGKVWYEARISEKYRKDFGHVSIGLRPDFE